jgi:hypothetical protein
MSEPVNCSFSSFDELMILDNLTVLYLAAVLLKQLVKKHWQEGEDSFEPPVVSVDEKVNMLSFLF